MRSSRAIYFASILDFERFSVLYSIRRGLLTKLHHQCIWFLSMIIHYSSFDPIISMCNQKNKIDRNSLYNQVWRQSMSKLAPTYGISDVMLKKICRQMDIPTPPRGYWAKVQNNIRVDNRKRKEGSRMGTGTPTPGRTCSFAPDRIGAPGGSGKTG